MDTNIINAGILAGFILLPLLLVWAFRDVHQEDLMYGTENED